MKISTLARKSLAASAIVGLAAFGTPAIAASVSGLTTAPELTSLEPLAIVPGVWASPALQAFMMACKAEVVSGSESGSNALNTFLQGPAKDCSPMTGAAGDTIKTVPTDLKTAVMYPHSTRFVSISNSYPHVLYVEDGGQSRGVVWTKTLKWTQAASGDEAANSKDGEEERAVSYEGPLLASATGRNAVAETAGILSFKGKRLNLVTGATIGGIAVTVASASKSALEITFESLPAGKHDVVLTSKSGAKLTLRGFVTVN